MTPKKAKKSILSPREQRLIGFMKPGQWVPSTELLAKEFKGKRRPMNARNCITSAMWNAGRKLQEARAGSRIVRRGGGRSGTEYMVTGRK